MNVLELKGCAPTPLAYYLKALGVLRLVAQQVDAKARGWWKHDCFYLASSLNEEGLMRFLLEDYQPTPLLAPWNNGTGFYKEDKAHRLLDWICDCRHKRFDEYTRVIEQTRILLRGVKEAPSKEEKARLQKWCVQNWSSHAREWAEAAFVIVDGDRTDYPSLLGSGGNDGHLDFSVNFISRLKALLDNAGKQPRSVRDSLAASLWNLTTDQLQKGAAVGQFLPGGVGGVNSTTGLKGDSYTNPWDYILMLEGAVTFRAGVSRRLASEDIGRSAAPFTMFSRSASYGAASPKEESTRGEQWMPIWSNPLRYQEFQHFLAEGRITHNRKTAKHPLDAARAVANLGVARGVDAFYRYGYLQRNGDAHYAVPLRVHNVPRQVLPQLHCLDDLDRWTSCLHSAARDKRVPQRLVLAVYGFDETMFKVVQHADEAQRWQQLLLAMHRIEAIQRKGTAFTCGPMPGLRSEWAEVANDGSPEFRVALALSQLQWTPAISHEGVNSKAVRKSFRQFWLPLEEKGRACYATSAGGDRIGHDPDVVMEGRDAMRDLCALVERGMLLATQAGTRIWPLHPGRQTVSLSDLTLFLEGAFDYQRCLDLACSLSALKEPCIVEKGPREAEASLPPVAWDLLRLLHTDLELKPDSRAPFNASILRLLRSGNSTKALQLALQRYRSLGLEPRVYCGGTDPAAAIRWAAALALPLSEHSERRLLAHSMHVTQHS